MFSTIRFKEEKFLEGNVNTSYRDLGNDLSKNFAKKDTLIYCIDVDEVMRSLGHEHNPEKHR